MPKKITVESLMGISNKQEYQHLLELNLESIQQNIAEQKKLPVQRRDYLFLYLSVEKFILDNIEEFTKETLRQHIKGKFNTQWYPPRIRALFNTKDPEHIIFTEMLIEQVIKQLVQLSNPAVIQRTVNGSTKNSPLDGIIVAKEQVDFPHQTIFASQEEFPNIRKMMREFILHLYQYAITNFGSSKAKEILSAAYSQVEEKYETFPPFIEVIKSLPEGMLETERYSLLSKEELEKVSKRLKQVDVMKSQFINIAAHELKTPLVPMKGFLTMMKDKPKKYGLNKKGREYVEICLGSVKRLQGLVDDILVISKLEAGEMKFQMSKVNLLQILKDAVAEFRPLARQSNLLLKTGLPGRLPAIYGDPQRLAQVIDNLITNAIKFTEGGSVVVEAKKVDRHIQVSVTDTGIGVSKENIPKLFSKFFQIQEVAVRKTKGTGLGLAISKEIVNAHKGKIWVESEGIGKGSAFSFSLPIGNK